MSVPTARVLTTITAAAVASAGLIACSSTGPAASAPATAPTEKHTTLTFVGHDEQGNMALEDLGAKSAPGGPDLGDVLAFTQTLTVGKTQAGEVHVAAVGVDHIRHLSEATGTITLSSGTIQLAGTVSMTPRFSLAITGGTGNYTGDTGTVVIDASGSTQKLIVHLTSRP